MCCHCRDYVSGYAGDHTGDRTILLEPTQEKIDRLTRENEELRGKAERIKILEWQISALKEADKQAQAQLAEARDEIDHWKVKAECYGNMVHNVSPVLAEAGYPVDNSLPDGAVGGVAKAVEKLRDKLAEARALLRLVESNFQAWNQGYSDVKTATETCQEVRAYLAKIEKEKS
jgi:DNA repair exonuclease SbcCD ATPase subunit